MKCLEQYLTNSNCYLSMAVTTTIINTIIIIIISVTIP